jgi:hypothetical protein
MNEMPQATIATEEIKSYESDHHKQLATYRRTWEMRNPALPRN